MLKTAATKLADMLRADGGGGGGTGKDGGINGGGNTPKAGLSAVPAGVNAGGGTVRGDTVAGTAEEAGAGAADVPPGVVVENVAGSGEGAVAGAGIVEAGITGFAAVPDRGTGAFMGWAGDFTPDVLLDGDCTAPVVAGLTGGGMFAAGP